MNHREYARAHLAENLDARGDLAPPWEKFPTYERMTIGWRMGHGETWLGFYHAFTDSLGPAFDARLAYLQRHAPAPVSWADWVWSTLHPDEEDEEDEDLEDDAHDTRENERRSELRRLGLIASDVAFTTWLRQQERVRWPWEHSETPENAARYWTRELWFWSRQVSALRAGPAWRAPEVPEAWQACAAPLATGSVGEIDAGKGLLSLARMLSAGAVSAPWQIGLDVADFTNSFEMDMGYVDAFRLWGMSAFDDREHLQRYLDATAMPARWASWISEQFFVD
jgi:hypothetical protein